MYRNVNSRPKKQAAVHLPDRPAYGTSKLFGKGSPKTDDPFSGRAVALRACVVQGGNVCDNSRMEIHGTHNPKPKHCGKFQYSREYPRRGLTESISVTRMPSSLTHNDEVSSLTHRIICVTDLPDGTKCNARIEQGTCAADRND